MRYIQVMVYVYVMAAHKGMICDPQAKSRCTKKCVAHNMSCMTEYMYMGPIEDPIDFHGLHHLNLMFIV